MSTLQQIADDYFAGAGGWDLAARMLGIEARGIENMKAARATRDAAGLITQHDDVWSFRPDGKARGQIASPPCPTFSQAGKGSGRKALDSVLAAIADGAYKSLDDLRAYPVSDDDDRTRLVLTPLHFATQYDYEWLAWEQVTTVLPVWEACADVLRAEGWHVVTGIVSSEQYGVPQKRRRAVLLAHRSRPVALPTPTHSAYYPRDPERLDAGVLPWVSMADALGIEPGDAADLTLRMTKMENSAVRTATQPAPTIAFGHDANSARWFRGDEWIFHRPATTVVGSFKPEIVAAPGYRTTVSRQNAEGSVPVSIAEAGILQSFPADYPWQGAKGKQYLQAGNAVPVLLAKALLQVVATP